MSDRGEVGADGVTGAVTDALSRYRGIAAVTAIALVLVVAAPTRSPVVTPFLSGLSAPTTAPTGTRTHETTVSAPDTEQLVTTTPITGIPPTTTSNLSAPTTTTTTTAVLPTSTTSTASTTTTTSTTVTTTTQPPLCELAGVGCP